MTFSLVDSERISPRAWMMPRDGAFLAMSALKVRHQTAKMSWYCSWKLVFPLRAVTRDWTPSPLTNSCLYSSWRSIIWRQRAVVFMYSLVWNFAICQNGSFKFETDSWVLELLLEEREVVLKVLSVHAGGSKAGELGNDGTHLKTQFLDSLHSQIFVIPGWRWSCLGVARFQDIATRQCASDGQQRRGRFQHETCPPRRKLLFFSCSKTANLTWSMSSNKVRT